MINEKEEMNSFQKYFNERIVDVSKLSHVGNNYLYRVDLEKSQPRLLKRYAGVHINNWPRATCEFSALSALWKSGFRDIPQPLEIYASENVAVYSFEEGYNLKASEVREKDILRMADFLLRLHHLPVEAMQEFGPASAPTLSLSQSIEDIETRINHLSDKSPEHSCSKRVRDLFYGRIVPRTRALVEHTKRIAPNYNKVLPLDEQVLTPGDFGIHNLIVNENGKHVFIDFEYFGRNDPAAQFMNFLHHDRSADISRNLKDLFTKEYMSRLPVTPAFKERMMVIDPLQGMHWTLIFMNVMRPEYIDQLRKAGANIEKEVDERLSKAEKKLDNLYYLP